MASNTINTDRGSWTLDTRHEFILGKGAYGIVYRASDFIGRTVVAKMIDGKKHPRVLDQNFDKLMELNHDNVVRIFDVSRQAETVYLFMDFCKFGDMNTFVRNQELKMVDKLAMMIHIARGIFYLHSKDVIHRDIKPDNILIAQRMPLCLKLTDFDVSKILDPEVETSAMTSNVGTQAFKAPEFFRRIDKKKICYHRNVDVYAAGLTFLGMIQYKKGDVMIVPRIETPRFDSELHQPIGQLIAERIKYKVPELNIVVADEPLDGAAAMVTDPLHDVRMLIASMTCVEPERRLPAENVVTWLQDISKTTNLTSKIEVEPGATYQIPTIALCVVSHGGDKVLVRSAIPKRPILMFNVPSGTSSRIRAACDDYNLVCGLLNYIVELCKFSQCIRMYNMPSGNLTEFSLNYQPTVMCPGSDDTLFVIDTTGKLRRLRWDEERQELDTIYTIQTSIREYIPGMVYAEEANVLVLKTKSTGFEDDMEARFKGCVKAIPVPQQARGWQPGIVDELWSCEKLKGINIDPCGICAGPGRRVFLVDGLIQVLMLDALNGHVLQKILFEYFILDICWIQSTSSLGVLCRERSKSTLRCYSVKETLSD